MGKSALVIAIVLSLLIGGTGGYVMGTSGVNDRLAAARAQGIAEGRSETERRLNQKFVDAGISSPLDQPIRQVYGFVDSMTADGFVIKYDSAQFSVVETGILTKQVRLSSGTKLLKHVTKSVTPAEIQEAILAGGSGGGGKMVEIEPTDLQQSPSVPSAPPKKPADGAEAPLADHDLTVASEESAQASDIKVGSYVLLTVSNDARSSEVLEAARVVIYDPSALPSGTGTDPTKLPFGRGNVINLEVPYIPTKTAE